LAIAAKETTGLGLEVDMAGEGDFEYCFRNAQDDGNLLMAGGDPPLAGGQASPAATPRNP
jgi:hypothetical protein